MEPTIYKPSIYKGAGIYKAGAEGGGGGGGGGVIPFPDGFENIDFLTIVRQNNYGLLIPFTGFRANFNDNTKLKFIIKFVPKEFYASDFFFTLTNTSNSTRGATSDHSGYGMSIGWNGDYIDWNSVVITPYLNQDVQIECSLNKVKFDSYQYSVSNPADLIKSFCVGSKPMGSRCVNMELKKIEIYHENNLICSCFPAKRILDDVNGMFDIITNEFFTL